MIATVTSRAAGGKITVQMPGQIDPVAITATRTVADAVVGDSVVVWMDGSQAIAMGTIGVASVVPTPPPAQLTSAPPPPRTVEARTAVGGTSTLTPTWTGTWRAGSWRTDTSDLFQGDWTGRGTNSGAAFIDGWDAVGAISEATVHLERVAGAGNSGAEIPTMLLLGSPRTDTAFPSTLASSSGPGMTAGATAEWAVPAGWLAHMQSGAATGIGIQGIPYVKISGARLWVTVTWERTS